MTISSPLVASLMALSLYTGIKAVLNNPVGAELKADCYPKTPAAGQQCLNCQWNVSTELGKRRCFQASGRSYHKLGDDDDFVKVDCHPDPDATEERCLSRGCNWKISEIPGEPWCLFSYDKKKFVGYKVKDIVANSSTHFEAILSRLDSPFTFGNDDDEIKFQAKIFGRDEISIGFEACHRKQEPIDPLRSFIKQVHKRHRLFVKTNKPKHAFVVEIQRDPFGIIIKRRKTGQIIFDTFNISGFVHAEQYLSLTTKKMTYYAYGFGENAHRTLDHDFAWRKWGMFSRDEPSGGSVHNLYGVHPFHLALEEDGSAHGVLLVNANAQSIQLSPYPSITYRTIGGLLHFVIFAGPTPDQVIQQYTHHTGFPSFPPYWSLGFHLCRWGYNSTKKLMQVFNRNRQAGIPQDVQWLDIDYMDQRREFTFDKANFSDLPDIVTTLHDQKTKFVLIMEPAILSNDVTYKPLKDGLEQKVFVLDSRTKKPFEGKVWPGNCFFVDWTSPNATVWWSDHLKDFHEIVSFDGIWLDMNEPANFVNGSLTGCPRNKFNNPPFVPLYDQQITTKTLCMDVMHYLGRHYDLHSLYGYFESVVTNLALQGLFREKRPFILSRSTFVSSGTAAFHWTGDNTSDWPDLEWSIITSIEFNMFGMPFVGADICGFNRNSEGDGPNEELCTRWMQLDAFYPFSRNHNYLDKQDQDPAAWSQASINSSRNALMIRYKYLPFLYTLLWQSNVRGSTVMRPLFFEFPDDKNTYTISDQFLWGTGFMVVPILEPQTFIRKVYFPQSRWYWLLNGTELDTSSERFIDIPIGMFEIGLFIRGGLIVPWQEPAQNTQDSRKNPMGLLVALDHGGNANGFLYWDDGETITGNGHFSLLEFDASTNASKTEGLLTIKAVRIKYNSDVKLDTVKIFGLGAKPATVKLNGVQLSDSQMKFDLDSKASEFLELQISIFSGRTMLNVIEWKL